MLNIKSVKNSLISDESKDGFCGSYSISIVTKLTSPASPRTSTLKLWWRRKINLNKGSAALLPGGGFQGGRRGSVFLDDWLPAPCIL